MPLFILHTIRNPLEDQNAFAESMTGVSPDGGGHSCVATIFSVTFHNMEKLTDEPRA